MTVPAAFIASHDGGDLGEREHVASLPCGVTDVPDMPQRLPVVICVRAASQAALVTVALAEQS